VFAFVFLPGCEVLGYCSGSDLFTLKDLLGQVKLAFDITAIVWVIYLIACLISPPLRDVSAEEPWKPSKDFHIEVSKGDEQNE